MKSLGRSDAFSAWEGFCSESQMAQGKVGRYEIKDYIPDVDPE